MSNDHGRQRRSQATPSEGILWSLLRAKQVAGLKFRREHGIGPWIVDFACVEKLLVVEVDGGYHDENIDADQRRQADLENRGWRVIRFSAQQVEEDGEAVVRAIASEIGVEYEFRPRKKLGSGQRSVVARQPKR